jgi:hypothetical protein
MRLIWLRRRLPRRWRRELRRLRKRWRALGRARRGVRLDERAVRALTDGTESRMELWTRFLTAVHVREMAEIGVWKGDFAAGVLAACDGIEAYYMIDPWRPLTDWNKPANRNRRQFERIFDEAMEKTSPWAAKRVVLRGRTKKVIRRIPDGTLDFAYIDGDHTLRGITIDLVRTYAKVREGGWIGGDDFSPSIWQHEEDFEPTLVFPFALHFAAAVGARIYALPHGQFLLEKRRGGRHEFIDLTGLYEDTALRGQLLRPVRA